MVEPERAEAHRWIPTTWDVLEARDPGGDPGAMEALKDSACEYPDEFERARLQMGFYKEFLDQLVPLSCLSAQRMAKGCC